jgi:hypothetical protein
MHRSYTTYAGAEVIDQGEFDVTWEQVRELRDYWLKKTDWRAMKDRTMSAAWKDYRTALRDLPQDHDEANDAADNWPEAPE